MLIEQHTIPMVTPLVDDFLVHDLGADGAEMLSGTFLPTDRQVMIDIDAAYSMLGTSRGALLLYVGQPDVAGSRLYDSGGQPLPGVDAHSVGSVNGESAWAGTTHRRLVLDVDPERAVTWQLLAAIIGGGGTVPVAGAPQRIAITPNGKKAFVTSPRAGTVTPIVLGRPGYSYDQTVEPVDVAQEAVATGGAPLHVSVDDAHVVVSNGAHAENRVSILSTETNEVLRQVPIAAGRPLTSAITPDGNYAIIGTATGAVARVTIGTGGVVVVRAASDQDRMVGAAVLPDGRSAFVADASSGIVHRLGLPAMDLDAAIRVGDSPCELRAAPDGQVWVLCRPSGSAPGRLKRIDPVTNELAADYELPYAGPADFAIVPVAGQSSEVVRSAWVVFDGGRYCQFYIGGDFAGQAHSIHHDEFDDRATDVAAGVTGVAVNDYGEIWVVQSSRERVWRWPGGRLRCRPGSGLSSLFYGEYCTVAVYGASPA